MNKIILTGNLGGMPELKETKDNKPYLTFSIATNEKYRNKEGESVQTTEWHTCMLYGKRAISLAPHLEKGQRLDLVGQLKYWQEDDKKVAYVQIDQLEFSSPKAKDFIEEISS